MPLEHRWLRGAMTPNVLNIGETITKEDGSRWVRVDVGIDWRDPASDTVVSVSAVIPVKLDQGSAGGRHQGLLVGTTDHH